MYEKTKDLIDNKNINEYKEYSYALAKNFSIENVLKDFYKELIK